MGLSGHLCVLIGTRLPPSATRVRISTDFPCLPDSDTICDLGGVNELANYGEYSGAPSEQQTYDYAKTILSLMTREKHPDGETHTLLPQDGPLCHSGNSFGRGGTGVVVLLLLRPGAI